MAEALRLSEVFPESGTGVMPLAIRVNDALYAWRLTSVDARTGKRPEGPVEQMGQAIRNMQAVVEAAGLSVDNVAKATGYIRDPADRDAVYEHWDALYPDPNDRPAFKVLITEELQDGEEAWLQMLAYAGERRTRFDIPGVPARDPTVKVGPWVFSSRVHGTDRANSSIPSGVDSQVKLAFENLTTLIGQAGGSTEHITQVTAFMRELDIAPVVEQRFRAVTAELLPQIPLRIVRSFVRPEMEAMLEMSAALNDGPAVLELSTPGAPGRPVPAGIQIGSLMYIPELRGLNASTGELAEGYEQQIRQALRNAELILEHSGASLDNVAHATVYLRDLSGHPVLNKVWPEFFPDTADRPPHKYVPADLPEGVLAQVHITAVRGARRTVLEITGMQHQDPMSMGARIGNLIFSSRIVGTDTTTGETPEAAADQARLAFENVQTLLKLAGATTENLAQVTAFIPDASHRALVEKAFNAALPSKKTRPPLNVIEVALPRGALVRLEIIAAL